jgi:serine/threonine protein kinase
MTHPEICSGLQHDWALLKKLGEGDAGEVYLVRCELHAGPSAEAEPAASLHAAGTAPAETSAEPLGPLAILKRPRKSPFSSDVLRQASQIETEGRILTAVSAALQTPVPSNPSPQPSSGSAETPPETNPSPAATLRVPALLDQARPGARGSDRFFIVIEQAPGYDLSFLARIATMGRIAAAGTALSPEQNLYLQSVAASRKVPERILLSAVLGLLELFETIHTLPVELDSASFAGLIWNDVKPDHLFWDPSTTTLTVIDWGNGRFLGPDGATADRQSSRLDDYRQFVEELGRFLSLTAPDLKTALDWPALVPFDGASPAGFSDLKKKLLQHLQASRKALKKARQREAGFLKLNPEKEDPFTQITEVHAQVIACGEVPDYANSLLFSQSYAAAFVKEDRLDTLRAIAEWAALLPQAHPDGWQIIARVAQIAGTSEGERRRRFLDAIQSIVVQDWDSALWRLVEAIHDLPEPDWWYDLSTAVRRQKLDLPDNAVTPLVSLKRIHLALQAILRQVEDRAAVFERAAAAGKPVSQPAPDPAPLRALLRRLREEILPNWLRVDPAPPFSNLLYTDIDGLLEELAALMPGLHEGTAAALQQPHAAVATVLDAWKRRNFLATSQALRSVLMWDPDRRRVLRADHAILNASAWLKKVSRGPVTGEALREFATRIEFEGRELRNQVGPAPWLDEALEAAKQLRRGIWPADLLASDPDLLTEMPWLKLFARHDRDGSVSDSSTGQLVNGESTPNPQSASDPSPIDTSLLSPPLLSSSTPGSLGAELIIGAPLDAWMPEARGSSARVYEGLLRAEDGQLYPTAVKLMRVDQADYAMPLFHEEVEILHILEDVPGVTPMYECGFIRFDSNQRLPDEASGESPTGRLQRIAPSAPRAFQDDLAARVRTGWVPYIALQPRRREDNLLMFCDAGQTGGRFLPLTDLLRMSIQICDILQVAHDRNIVYRDHKILHYYWVKEANGIYMIDWNVARFHPNGLSEVEKHMDLVQFGARALHHILTGRTAPGALPMGPTRPEEIEQAADTYSAQWTYDDQRLTEELKGILETALAGSYTRPDRLGLDLKQAYFHLRPEGS